MLNITTITTGMAAHYYKKDDYYQNDSNQFGGKLCRQFGIEPGGYDEDKFLKYLRWEYGNDETPAQSKSKFKKESKKIARAAIDLTFSAPKSVSMVGLLFKRDEVVSIHRQAVQEAMSIVEENACYRMTSKKLVALYKASGEEMPEYIKKQFEKDPSVIKKGFPVLIKATGILYTQVQHAVSRLDLKKGLGGDPDLHSHVVMAMHTRCSLTGKLITIDLKSIYQNQKSLDAIYKQALARQLRQADYAIRPTEHGFEIEGITKQQLDVYSDGSRIRIAKFADSEKYDHEHWIKIFGKEFDIKDAAHRNAANKATRGGKKIKLSNAQSQVLWETKAQTNGISIKEMIAKVQIEGRRIKNKEEVVTSLEFAIKLAAKHMTEKQSAIRSMSDFMMSIHLFSEFHYSPAEVDAAIEKALGNGFLIMREDGKSMTTIDRVINEKTIENTYRNGLKTGSAICTPEQAQASLESYESEKGFQLTEGQKDAYLKTMASTDRYSVWIGDAGTGKSTVMELVRLASERFAKTEVVGFAPSNSAVKALSKSIPNTITSQSGAVNDKFWHKNVYDRLAAGKNVQIILDESSLVDSEAMSHLMRKVELAKSFCIASGTTIRMIVVGDNKQFSSVQAGSVGQMLAELSSEAGSEIRLSEMIRARKNKKTQELHKSARDTPEKALIDMLTTGGRSISIDDRDERHAYLAAEFVKLSDAEQEESLVLTGKNVDRVDINKAIRDGLKAAGRLGGNDIEISTFEPNQHTKAEANYAGTYKKNDIIRFEFGVTGVAEKGERLTVVDLIRSDRGSYTVQLKKANGEMVAFAPREHGDKVSIGRFEKIAVADLELIRFTSTAKTTDENGEEILVKNGAGGRIICINALRKTITFKLNGNNKQLTMSVRDAGLPIRYQACKTGHSSQGLGADKKCWINEPSDDATINKQSFYTNITRSTDHLEIVTDASTAKKIEILMKSVGKEAQHDRAMIDRKIPAAKTMNLVWNKALTQYRVLNDLPGKTLFEKLAAARTELGGSVQLTGSNKFKKSIITIAQSRKMDMHFFDAASRKIQIDVENSRKIKINPAENTDSIATKIASKPLRARNF